MSATNSNHSQIDLFLQGEKDLTLPFDLNSSNGTKYRCTKILRILPKKRLVLLARDGEKQVVIKLFSPAHKGQREFDREIRGSDLVHKASVETPALLEKNPDLSGCFAVVYDYIENAESFNLNKSSNKNEHIKNLLETTAKLHNYGIYQQDIHLDNILITENKIHLIDLGSIICEHENKSLNKQKSLKNLALLFAQFFPLEQAQLVDSLGIYYQARDWPLNDHEHDQTIDESEHQLFLDLLARAWHKRKRHYLSKCFRTCTMTSYQKNFTQESAFRSNFLNGIDPDFVSNIDQYLSSGDVLKAGNSATVVRAEVNGIPLLIKRYNIKSFWHFLKRFWRPTRAAISWRNANLLEFIGLPTPKPYGFIEKRLGWFRTTAYFITEYIESEELLGLYQKRKPTDNELDQINNLFMLLQNDQISHGDFKTQNLLIDKSGRISLIDLDAMREHSNYQSFQSAFIKDKKRFIRNWHDAEIKEIFESLLF